MYFVQFSVLYTKVSNIAILVQFLMEINWKQLRIEYKFTFATVLWIKIEVIDSSIQVTYFQVSGNT